LARNIAQIKTGGQVVYGICLFTDVADYTSLAETMDPAELGQLMNRYYETMFRPIKQHGGFVSGVIGDSMLALWVSSGSEAALRNKACLAAVDIRKALKQLEQSQETVKLKIRIGLHCGYILLGHIGALDHYEYTPMGDIVNTASRIEGLNKHLGTGILVSEEIIRQLDGFLIRELGQFRMAGKSKPIGVYEILTRTEESNGKLRDACTIFAEGLNAYRRKSWDEAIEKFHQSIEKSGEDGPAHFYITLCETYKKNPPGEAWNEVVYIDRK
jgi:adenylate cyclase